MKFTLDHKDASTEARAGTLTTDHGSVQTPVFMPVGTAGTVKALEQRELLENGAQIILGNTYHLYLKPGTPIIRQAGGLHRFINWRLPILTDSGGYQVFSLTELNKISDEGVRFQSHYDGSAHFFTPESVVDIQRELGSDIMMVLDECTPYPCTEEYAESSNRLTVAWALRCKNHFEKEPALYDHAQSLFAIVQGSVYPSLREQSADQLVEMNFDGYAIGGLSVGEPKEDLYAMAKLVCGRLPRNKPKYLMGVGTPEDLLENIESGVDLFDCVMPTRNARNGTLFTSRGRKNMRNTGFSDDLEALDPDCECYTCRSFSRAYLRHLFNAKEILGLQLATLHNVHFYVNLVAQARSAILENRFVEFKSNFLSLYRSDQ